MADQPVNSKLNWLFTIINLVIGWHLLYEGVAKVLTPSWSAAGFLQNSNAIFSWMADSSALISFVNIFNIIALLAIGLLLFTGTLVRPAAIAGFVLLGLYYLATIPLEATSVGYASEGHYLLINKTLIEALALLVMAVIPRNWYYGLGKIFESAGLKTGVVQMPDEVNHNLDQKVLDRRHLLKNLVSVPFLGGFAFTVAKNHGWLSFEEKHLKTADGSSGATLKVSEAVDLSELRKKIPSGKLGNLEMGRLICGGNLISGYAHSRDLIYVSTFLKKYFTQKKIMDTFWLCEQCGIDTTAVSARPQEVELLKAYWKEGGKMKWLAPVYPKKDNFRENIDLAIDSGASAAMIMGNVGDEWARDGEFELMQKTLDYIKSQGLPAGLAGHELNTFKSAEGNGVEADFYMKTLHSKKYWSWQDEQQKEKMVIDNYAVDNYWARQPEDTIDFMNQLEKPWIAFKILAAGAIHPRDGFRYVFEKGADFACVGMFDFQVVENANIFTEIMDDKEFKRERKWMA